MYRNCERYLSGAITEQEFIVQAARDQRAMVHVLAIEQLAGTSKAQSTALTTLAKAASSGVTADAIQSLDKAESNAQKTRATAEKARADAVGATPTGACETGIDAYKGSSATPDQITAKKAACNAAEKAESDAKHAASHYATLKNAIDRQTQISSEASGTLSSAAMSAQAASQTTSDAIVRIVQLNNDFNEMEMTCVVLLRNIDKYANKPRLTTGDDQFFNKCIELLSKIIERDKSELDLEISRAKEQTTAIQSRTNEMLDEIKADAEKVWDAIRNDSVVDDSKLTALENEANISLPSGPKNKLLQAKSFEEFQNAFGGLIFKYQKKLGEAASN
jgi:chaperonin cofactor prefoldin